ncbi:DUF1365 domain-containing protein [Marinospirillum perlucidum]|uniref:DUF1365 domain-containing protein n=1 Tax=Marinospirillum perlucidum TaxID=1982602 RepID=UPI000DF3D322|nr:DUF1365 domain-containing protein [Marinospirillum perlucidum]
MTSPRKLTSAFYTGWVRHRRYYPAPHQFRYRLFMCWLNLDELDQLPWTQKKRFWRWAAFHRQDYLGPAERPLKAVVLDQVEQKTGQRPDGAVFLLTQLRYGGLCFNPISLYYCFDRHQHLQAVVGEVSNIPWKERQLYVASCDPQARRHEASFEKRMHVSPFNPMQQTYVWQFNTPDKNLVMHMENQDREGSIPFDATLVMQRRDDLGLSMGRLLLRHPWMTLKVLLAIHFEALRLALKKNPVYPHPAKRGV